MDKKEFLKGVSIFSGLSDQDLGKLAEIAQEKSYLPQDVIFAEGTPGDTLSIVMQGEVKIQKAIVAGKKKVLATIKPGEIFGEFSLFDRLPHSAAAIANQELKLLVINREDLFSFMEKDKDFAVAVLKSFINELCRRLRVTNEQFRDKVLWGFTTKI